MWTEICRLFDFIFQRNKYTRQKKVVISVMLDDGTLAELPRKGSKQKLIINPDGTADIVNEEDIFIDKFKYIK